MRNLRVNNVTSDLIFDLKVMALDKDLSLRELVIEILTAASTKHMASKSPIYKAAHKPKKEVAQ